MGHDLSITPGVVRPSTPSGGLRVDVLGPMQIHVGDRPLHVAGVQRRRLLGVLTARAGRVVPVDVIVDALWGDDPPPSAAKTVQSHVVRLRQSLALAGDPIETVAGGYRLAMDADRTDAARFERLVADARTELRLGRHQVAQRLTETALALWRGRPFQDLLGVGFADAERVRLEELRLAAVEDLATARIGAGAAATAVPDLERLVADDPGREHAWALLMEALCASGRSHDALVAYQRARQALAEQFGLEPGRELRDLEQRVIDQDPTLVPPLVSLPPAALRSRTPIVGRAAELAWLRAAWPAVAAGSGTVRVLTGPPGSGRTRLAAELAAHALAAGADVDHVAGENGVLGLLGASGWGGPGAVIDAVADRCRHVPLLLVVDDVEWSHAAAGAALRSLAAASGDLALYLVVIADTDVATGAALRRDLERAGATTMAVAPMPDDDVAVLVTSEFPELSGQAGAVAATVAAADGSPGAALREAAAWLERAATDRLQAAARSSLGASSLARDAGASVLDEVVRLVEARARRAALVSADWVGRQPYRSLAAYGPEDADLFVGRERVVAELVARLLDRRVVAVVGPSGSGKSSIVRAGLVPLVRSGRLPGGTPWRATVVVPGRDLGAALDSIAGIDEPGPQLVVIDQFEEAFGLDGTDAAGARLLELVLDPALDAHVVLVIRSDRVGGLVESPSLVQLVEGAQVLVGSPSIDEVRRIVEDPARRTGCSVDPELVELVVADVVGHESALPLLSAAMAEVWERRDGDRLRADTYVAIGGLAAAVERLGDRAVAAVGSNGLEALRDAALRLVDVTDDGAWVRRRVAAAALPPHVQPAMDALVDARLAAHHGMEVEIVHEVVFHAWPRLGSWLDDARAELQLERDLRGAARVWEAQGRHDDDVLRGARQLAAAEWVARHPDASPAVVALVDAGERVRVRDEVALREQLRRERRTRRTLGAALVAASVLLVLAVVGTSVAVRSSRSADAERRRADDNAVRATEAAGAAEVAAQEAEARRAAAHVDAIVARSAALADRNPGLAMLLAVEARREADTPSTRGALLTSLVPTTTDNHPVGARCCLGETARRTASSFLGYVDGPSRIVGGLDVSDDGRVAVTVGGAEDGSGFSVLMFDTVERRLVDRLVSDVRPVAASVRADGAQLLLADATAVRLFALDGDGMTETAVVRPDDAAVVGAFYLSDQERVVVATDDHRLTAYAADTAEPLDLALPDSPVDLAGPLTEGRIIVGVPFGAFSWAVDTAGPRVDIPVFAPSDVNIAAALDPASRLLALYEPDGALTVTDLESGTEIGAEENRPTSVRSVAFDPLEPRVLAIARSTGDIVLWDLDTDRAIGAPLRAHPGGIRAVAFAADGRLFAAYDEGGLAIWGPNAEPTALSTPIGADGALLGRAADGSRTLVGGTRWATAVPSDARRDTLVPLSSQRYLRQLAAGPDEQLFPWSLSADGSVAVGGVSGPSGEVVVVDPSTGAVRWRHVTGSSGTHATAGPDGTRVVVLSDGQHRLQVWDITTGALLADVHADQVRQGSFFNFVPAFDQAGERVAVPTSVAGVVAIVDATTGRLVTTEPPRGGDPSPYVQGTAAFDPVSGDVLAVGSGGAILRWDGDTGALLDSSRSPDPSNLGYVTVSADGSLVAAAHPFSSSVALFDGATLDPIGRPIRTGDVSWSPLVFGEDSTSLYANDPFNRAARFELDPDAWEATACELAGRNLTRAEWREHIGDDVPYRTTCRQWPSGA